MYRNVICVGLLVTLMTLTCERQITEPTKHLKQTALNDQQIRSLTTKKIFFGHQSVGDNIVEGIRDLMAADPRLKINLVNSSDPQEVTGVGFVEAHIGVNRNPQSKTDAFSAIVDRGLGPQGGIALCKYCYIDFGPSTDVQQVFQTYRAGVTHLKEKYPALIIVHSTVPLTTEDAGQTMKERIKTILRRIAGRDLNIKRNQFNQLLRQAYEGKSPIFDIAEVESTHPDGSRSYFMHGFQRVYTLAPEYTTDGGHLNETGRRAAAEQLLVVLANL